MPHSQNILKTGRKILYLSVPVGYRLWDKEKSKLALAAELVAQAMKTIGPERQVILIMRQLVSKSGSGRSYRTVWQP